MPAHKRYFLLHLSIILYNAKQAVILNKIDVALCVILNRRWAAYQQGQRCKLGALPVIYIASRWIRANSPAPGFISQERRVCNASSVEIARNRGTWGNLILTRKFKKIKKRRMILVCSLIKKYYFNFLIKYNQDYAFRIHIVKFE